MQQAKMYTGAPQFQLRPVYHTVVRTISNPNWVGPAAKQSDNSSTVANFRGMSAYWNVPSAGTSPAGDWASPWVGMGGINTGSIVQAGQDSTPGSPAAYAWWWEDYPQGTNYCSSNCPGIAGGTSAYVSVYDNLDGTASFFWENVGKGTYTSWIGRTPYIDDSSADAIVEYAQTSNYWNFGTVHFTGVTASYVDYTPASRDINFGNLNVQEYYISHVACTGSFISSSAFDTSYNTSC